jgi:hypothetical protein
MVSKWEKGGCEVELRGMARPHGAWEHSMDSAFDCQCSGKPREGNKHGSDTSDLFMSGVTPLAVWKMNVSG